MEETARYRKRGDFLDYLPGAGSDVALPFFVRQSYLMKIQRESQLSLWPTRRTVIWERASMDFFKNRSPWVNYTVKWRKYCSLSVNRLIGKYFFNWAELRASIHFGLQFFEERLVNCWASFPASTRFFPSVRSPSTKVSHSSAVWGVRSLIKARTWK